MPHPPRLSEIDLSHRLKDKQEYEARLQKIQLDLLEAQQRFFKEKRRLIIGFEGWDAAGKGGSIRRLTEKLDPRSLRVHPIAAPSAEEQGKHYLYRFWTRLPAPGEWAIFDRTWYGRVLVERIEKYCAKDAWKRAYDEIARFEQMLVEDGAVLVKIFLHISPEEQLKRFREREENPYKRFKITPEDWRNREKWDEYRDAIDEMFERTHTKYAPWLVVPAEHRWSARLAVCEAVVRAAAKH